MPLLTNREQRAMGYSQSGPILSAPLDTDSPPFKQVPSLTLGASQPAAAGMVKGVTCLLTDNPLCHSRESGNPEN